MALAGGFAAVPVLAEAAEPACPVRPPAYEPEEPPADANVVGELRALRADLADACAAQVAAVAAIPKPAVPPAVQRVTLDGLDADHPLPVHDGEQRTTLALDSDSTSALGEAFAGSVEVLHTDLWFLFGLLCALPFSYFLVRVVMARA